MAIDSIVLNDWYAVAGSEAIQEGSVFPARLLEEDLVLWRSNGKVLALQDLCVHRGVRLSLGWVEDNTVVCPYHGWAYDTKGQCVRIPAHPTMPIPARACVKSYLVQERYGLVWVSLGIPERDIPSFPMWEDPTYRKITCKPLHYNTSGVRAIEGFIDVAHFSVLHKGVLGDPSHQEINNYQVKVDTDGITASDISLWQPDPYGKEGGGAISDYIYHILRPLTVYMVKKRNGFRAIFLTVTPVEELKSIAWFAIATNSPEDTDLEQIADFAQKLSAQDIFISESQRPLRMPLNLDAEFLVVSDLMLIAYRKWLKKMGFTFGTTFVGSSLLTTTNKM